MLQALESSLYYVAPGNSYNQQYNVVSKYSYQGSKIDFKGVIDTFRKDINVRRIFGNNENICYRIFEAISTYYDQLLIGELDRLLIVSRRDNAILITKTSDPPIIKPHNVGIIKMDSVLAELNISKYNNVPWLSYVYYVFGFSGIIFFGTKVYNGMRYSPNFYKN